MWEKFFPFFYVTALREKGAGSCQRSSLTVKGERFLHVGIETMSCGPV
jgi:hypothetical protein